VKLKQVIKVCFFISYAW